MNEHCAFTVIGTLIGCTGQRRPHAGPQLNEESAIVILFGNDHDWSVRVTEKFLNNSNIVGYVTKLTPNVTPVVDFAFAQHNCDTILLTGCFPYLYHVRYHRVNKTLSIEYHVKCFWEEEFMLKVLNAQPQHSIA
ncbi:hypothetical protein Tcan_02484 [Toxocara canis]|uniref:Uncharacterized protein n=1 Tax=Toxocara canis TaxID=6265 RepID=A0A0B2UQD3_TOXCA|nr:hypothetical protein Tcan_02484 [Toxocara canis]